MRLVRSNRRIKKGLDWFRRPELRLLISVAAISAVIWLFLSLADEVSENETMAVDEMILLALRNPGDPSDPIGPGWMQEMGRDFTALGSVGVLSLITLGTCIYLLLLNRKRAALFTLGAIGGGWLVSNLLKLGFNRPRPDLFPHDFILYTASFPSGHALMSAVTYLTLAALLTRTVSTWRLRSFFLLSALFLTLLVGASRVYLGVHWPTDVVAGWMVGAAWAGLCWLVERWLQQRGIVEPTADSDEDGP